VYRGAKPGNRGEHRRDDVYTLIKAWDKQSWSEDFKISAHIFMQTNQMSLKMQTIEDVCIICDLPMT